MNIVGRNFCKNEVVVNCEVHYFTQSIYLTLFASKLGGQ